MSIYTFLFILTALPSKHHALTVIIQIYYALYTSYFYLYLVQRKRKQAGTSEDKGDQGVHKKIRISAPVQDEKKLEIDGINADMLL